MSQTACSRPFAVVNCVYSRPATTADLDEDGDDGEDEMELEDDAEEAEASTDESDDE